MPALCCTLVPDVIDIFEEPYEFQSSVFEIAMPTSRQ